MNLIEKIKQIIKELINKIFKKDDVKLLQGATQENYIKEEPVKEVTSKEEFLEVYKNIKENKVEIANLTKEELIMFITLAKQELSFLNKKIADEKIQYNIPKQEFELYKVEFEKISEASVTEIFGDEAVIDENNEAEVSNKEEIMENDYFELNPEAVFEMAIKLKKEIEDKNQKLIKDVEKRIILQEKTKKLQEIINEFTKRKNEFENA